MCEVCLVSLLSMTMMLILEVQTRLLESFVMITRSGSGNYEIFSGNYETFSGNYQKLLMITRYGIYLVFL